MSNYSCFGGLNLTVEGPGKGDLNKKDNADGSQLIDYKPTQEGAYKISLKFADEHVPGSPFKCKVGGMSQSTEVETITRTQAVVATTHVGSDCQISLKVPGSEPMDMIASITPPEGDSELCEIIDDNDDHYTVKFRPRAMGSQVINVKYKGLHVQGSPFMFTVGQITEGGTHRVHASGPGLERGEVGEDNEFNIYTREAGAGSLAVSIEGPSKPRLAFEDKFPGSSIVNYRCTEPGAYKISVKFNNEDVPDSPFRVVVMPSAGDAKRVSVQKLQHKDLRIGKPVQFTTVHNGASGVLCAVVIAPSGAKDEAIMQRMDDTGGHHLVRFCPRENGLHYLHVLLENIHIRGSPFRCVVGDSIPDPGLVVASGEGLSSAVSGQESKFNVNTVGAGASSLSVTVDGPSKAEISTTDAAEGYDFGWKPSCAGIYYISIKYSGNFHIAGSPFKATVTGGGTPSGRREHTHCVVATANKSELSGPTIPKFHSDASKIVSKGLGLNKAFCHRSAQFSVDVSQAGQNLLYVAALGPENSPPVGEVTIKSAPQNVYNCCYTPKSTGKYILLVKYGEQNIPGSPFPINVV